MTPATEHFIPYLLDLSAAKLTISSFQQINLSFNANILSWFSYSPGYSNSVFCSLNIKCSQELNDESLLLNLQVFTITEQLVQTYMFNFH